MAAGGGKNLGSPRVPSQEQGRDKMEALRAWRHEGYAQGEVEQQTANAATRERVRERQREREHGRER